MNNMTEEQHVALGLTLVFHISMLLFLLITQHLIFGLGYFATFALFNILLNRFRRAAKVPVRVPKHWHSR